ncbi:MAG: STAS domain-containing protein [Spirochaetes bacterium]|jgi:anti-sigma B factor antagonist|nr:STAS domain-containing protein [Spirochaetota bacterium]
MFFINHTETVKDKIVVVEVNGPLNSETCHGFESYIDQIIGDKKLLIIIDAEKLEFVSSVGIGAFIYSQKKIISNNGFMIICNLSDETTSLFKLLGFDKVFMIAGSKDEAFDIMNRQLEIRSEEMSRPQQAKTAVAEMNLEIDTEAAAGVPSGSEVTLEGTQDSPEFDSPIILECAECKSIIRIKRAGSYMCPDCKTDFSVDRDQTIIF